jgi:hypothetical protein
MSSDSSDLQSIVTGFLQPNLHIRQITLSKLAQLYDQFDSNVVLDILLNSTYNEKSWRHEIINLCGVVFDKLYQQNDIETLTKIVSVYHQYPTYNKSIVILGILHSCIKIESVSSYVLIEIRVLVISILEFIYFHMKTVQFHSAKIKVMSILGSTLNTLFDAAFISSCSLNELMIVSILVTDAKIGDAQLRTSILVEYCKKLIASKTIVSTTTLQGFKTFLASLSQSEYDQGLEGHVTRSIKKAPESAGPLVSTGMSSTTT